VHDFYCDKLPDAEKIIGRIDIEDMPYIALAISLNADGILAEDKHFSKQGAK
jgi:predicted nucleic acid-binding protein